MSLIDLDLMVKSAPFLLKGAAYTVELSLGGMVFGALMAIRFAIWVRELSLPPWDRYPA